jgi:2'-5' RNA ligase
VEGDERLRLFCALRLPADAVDALAEWQERKLGPALGGGSGGGARLVAPENLHLTLAFLGSRPAGDAARIGAALAEAARGSRELRLTVSGYRETRSVGMLTLDDDGGRAAALAARLHQRLEELGVYRRERRPWLPHITVLRFRERPRLRPELPELGEVGPSDAAVYISWLRPGGAQYEVSEAVSLGG